MGFKQLAYLGFVSRERQVTNIDLSHINTISLKEPRAHFPFCVRKIATARPGSRSGSARNVDVYTRVSCDVSAGSGPRPNVRGLVGSFRSWPICGSEEDPAGQTREKTQAKATNWRGAY